MERIKTIAKKLPLGNAAFNQILINYKRQASLRNLEFTLSKEQFQKLKTIVTFADNSLHNIIKADQLKD